jgi:hypothetical protein
MLTLTALTSLLALTATAAPNACKKENCMDDDQANQVADNFKQLISAYTKSAADAYLTSDVHDYSDSVSTLISTLKFQQKVRVGRLADYGVL